MSAIYNNPSKWFLVFVLAVLAACGGGGGDGLLGGGSERSFINWTNSSNGPFVYAANNVAVEFLLSNGHLYYNNDEYVNTTVQSNNVVTLNGVAVASVSLINGSGNTKVAGLVCSGTSDTLAQLVPSGNTYQLKCQSGSGSSGGTQGTDPNQVATMCASIAGNLFPKQAQNAYMQQAACLNYCVYSKTGDQRFYSVYQENQNNANSMCSIDISSTCNNIPLNQCTY